MNELKSFIKQEREMRAKRRLERKARLKDKPLFEHSAKCEVVFPSGLKFELSLELKQVSHATRPTAHQLAQIVNLLQGELQAHQLDKSNLLAHLPELKNRVAQILPLLAKDLLSEQIAFESKDVEDLLEQARLQQVQMVVSEA
ncbi:hypothetical protein NYR60_02840 [Actinobacillus genomosp. 2]|uniref:hypothetical protein n=1 Tax=Actinobacillus genomosp. 2 TaxID=230709 RepID=UPI002441506B|nr:hypothetical protein [Actinobacillus genomosp. 2]WGE32563.1 hypothetical protein NYR60_02840 [Actinobacillus genomosp. 2]